MNIQSFTKERATPAHGGTILASAVVPAGMKAPFDAAWGYLEAGKALEGHEHPTAEIYMVVQGNGVVTVGKETAPVGPSDVIEIPPNAYHSIAAGPTGPLLWAALWWKA
jgi:mannose-6-phosphate isomerase-like protein (cupin superfamily)